MRDFLFYMETCNTMQTKDKMWLYIGMEKEKKNIFSHICFFLFSMETYKAIQTINTMWRYTFKLRKKKFLCEAANQRAESRVEGSKCPCYEIISAQFKQTQTRMIVIVRWKKFNMIHQVSYSLTAKSKSDFALRLFSL